MRPFFDQTPFIQQGAQSPLLKERGVKMRVVNYTGGHRGQSAEISGDEIIDLRGTILSEASRSLVAGSKITLVYKIGPGLVDLFHEVEAELQNEEWKQSNRISAESTANLIKRECDKRIKNRQLSSLVASLIIEGWGLREIVFHVEGISNQQALILGHNSNRIAC